MRILSLTFHSENSVSQSWASYVETTLLPMVENLLDVEKYILSEVHSEMINEGSNTNLLLTFDNEDVLQQFIENEFINLEERIQAQFGDSILIFRTFLNPTSSRL